MNLEQYMILAIEEAKASLREGNKGFGAVIVKDGQVVAAAHDQEETDQDPTSHAEINAIRKAGGILGKNLAGCILVTTHEPCPMCSFAIIWSGIAAVAYGYSIREAITQKRNRIDFSCRDAFHTANADITIYPEVMKDACAVLYREDVRNEIKKLRNADDTAFAWLSEDSINRRTSWFKENKIPFNGDDEQVLTAGYQLLLERLHITEEQAPIIRQTEEEIVFHSQNFCPTLEACNILQLDTRNVCKKMNEISTDLLLKQLNGRLKFSRNYDKLRPYSSFCEEMVSLSKDKFV